MSQRQHRAELYLLLVTVVWGSTFVITKSFLDEVQPLQYTALRFLLAALLLLIFFFPRLRFISRIAWKKGAFLGAVLFLGFAMQTVGLQFTTASKSAFFTGTMVILTPIVHIGSQKLLALRRRDLRLGNVLGVLCATLGLYLLTSPSGSTFSLGDALTLVCALLFAVYVVYLDYASDVPDKLQLVFVQFLWCGGLGLLTAGVFETVRLTYSASFLVSLLYLTVFATIIAMWVQNHFQADTTPTRAALIFAMEPVVAGVFAYFVRGEDVGILGVVGASVMVAGLLLSELSDSLPLLNRVVLLINKESPS